jgi:hypothetical protein
MNDCIRVRIFGLKLLLDRDLLVPRHAFFFFECMILQCNKLDEEEITVPEKIYHATDLTEPQEQYMCTMMENGYLNNNESRAGVISFGWKKRLRV